MKEHSTTTPPSFQIIPATTPPHLEAARSLFTAYAQWLNIDLTFQGFAAELDALPGQYGSPHGELLLAYSNSNNDSDNHQAIGCVAVRPLRPKTSTANPSHPTTTTPATTTCEMKRLYVAPEARGLGLGKALVDAIVRRAKELGYTEMKLDTLRSMGGAIQLYRRAGFEEVGAYYETPLEEGTLFLGLRLGGIN